MNKSRNKIHAEEVCNFLKYLGYPNASAIETYGCDIEVASLGEKIQIFDGGWNPDQEIYLFLGLEKEDGFYWRLLDCNYVILVTPNRFHIVSSRSLLEFILANGFIRTHRVIPRKSKEAIVVKIRIPYLVYGIPDLRTFNRPEWGEDEKLENPYFEFSPINWEEYGL